MVILGKHWKEKVSSQSVVSLREFAEKNLFDIWLCKYKNFLILTCKIKVIITERHFDGLNNILNNEIKKFCHSRKNKTCKRLQCKENTAETSGSFHLQVLYISSKLSNT